MEKGDEIMALLEEDGPTLEEEVVDGFMRSLERDVIGVDSVGISATNCSSFGVCGQNCYLESDSAHSVTSSSALVSASDDLNAIGCHCQCGDQLGYLMEASDEELGLSPQPASISSSTEFEEGEVDLGMEKCNWLEDSGLAAIESSCFFNEMVDFETVNIHQGLLGIQLEWVPYGWAYLTHSKL